jgi:hypothetical protein
MAHARLVAERSPFPRLLAFPLLIMVAMFVTLARVNADLLMRSAHCALREGLDIPCPTCGGTLAAIRLAEGKPLEALAANPLLTLAAFAGGLWCLHAVVATFAPRWRRALSVDHGAALVIRWSVVALLLLNWFYELKLR